MHHLAPTSSQLGFLPSMYTFSGPTSLPELDLGPPSTSGHLPSGTLSNNSWETRCLRKHRRRVDDEGCLAKRRRLTAETELDIPHTTSRSLDWPPPNNSPPLCTQQVSHAPPQPCPAPHNLIPLQSSSSPSRPETENSCMEIEAAQRRLREIENRITLEDDDEDLDVEPAQRRPVLVISDSLKEGLQRGISDILPHTVAQSVSHSCMELVLWRPPEDPFCRRLKGSLQKQRKQQTVLRQPPTPCPSPTPHSAPADTRCPLPNFPVAESCGEEDMEM
ncbi:coiled-coil domain-containing protein 117 isoform X1 [Phycodurus eques]|uniref:coiled-coil domain-containing protein 117 isoform X1 n=1 Tax=Phycodurus eques TaxID=693459 RepID=UPI002ACE99AA|nr:coiled-coil domain-containing protein 117 isoform X1 [Phycodurus eques]